MKHYDLDGPAVARLRESKGLSQVDLADRCGVNPSYVSLLESGTRQPSSALALKIANTLRVKFADITRTKGYEGEEAETAKARAALATGQAAS